MTGNSFSAADLTAPPNSCDGCFITEQTGEPDEIGKSAEPP
jgi:hypothetical protein